MYVQWAKTIVWVLSDYRVTVWIVILFYDSINAFKDLILYKAYTT